MASRQSWQQTNICIIALVAIGVTIALANLAFPKHVSARERAIEPTFQVKAGFESHYRDGAWVPVQITLHNEGPDFNGILSLITPTPQFQLGGSQGIPSNYQASISLANGAQKQVTMYLPLYFDVQNVTVKLLDNSGHTVGSQSAPLLPLTSSDICIGILSDQSSGFSSLSALPLPNQGGSIVLEFLNANTMPTIEAALNNFNMIVLDNFTTANLSTVQLNALQNWTNQGGSLILIGGPEWHRTLGTLPADLVPIQISNSSTIPAGTVLLPTGGSVTPTSNQHTISASLKAPVPISVATLKPQENNNKSQIILASQTAPLIVQTQQEQGTIMYLAFDPTLEPILGWQDAGLLWNSLLLRSMGDQLLPHYGISPGLGSATQQVEPILANRMSGFLQSLLPSTIPPPWRMLGILFLCYVLLLGPVRFLLVKRLKGRYWSWRIILGSIVIFSLLSYGLAYIEKGSSILSDNISIAQFSQNGTSVHISTYMGVFVPNEGDYQVQFPGNTLVQPSPDNFSTAGPITGSHTTVEQLKSSANVNLQDVNIWTLHTILAEQDRQVHKGLVSQLTLQNGYLLGTVTNTFSYALNDTFLLMPDDAFKLGHLAAGETKRVQLRLSSVPLAPGSTLADLIALNTSSPTYDAMPAQPQNTWQRHLAILYALDGEGLFNFSPVCTGLCNGSVNPLVSLLSGAYSPSFGSGSTSSNYVGITATPGWQFTASREIDPLLVSGAPATFIGWAENAPDLTTNVTVGNTNPSGFHETLVQAPLSIHLSGSLNLPPNFIPGHLIGVTGNNAQLRFPGVYTISTGSMTFEYLIPQSSNTLINGLTITEPPDINLLAQAGSVPVATSPPFRLYNWHTNSWDIISLNQETFTTHNVGAYISATGRVILQFTNMNSQNSPLDFGRPIINLQGVISGQSYGSS